MKKLSLYIFLGLLWCNVGFAEKIILDCKGTYDYFGGEKSINNFKIYYIYSILFLFVLFFSFNNQIVFYVLVFLLILNLFKNAK